MRVKQADDKTSDIQALQNLLSHTQASAHTKRSIEQEIRFMKSGIKGESEAAYEIDFHYEKSKNWAVVHDIRIEHKGRVAQIDHIIINRFLEMWVCESKRFGEGIAVNEHGECAAFYAGKPYGIPSPFEQNRKHIAVLKSLFDDGAIDLPKRLGFSIKPAINSLIVVSKNARISRPKAKIAGVDDILKADQIHTHIQRSFDDDNNILLMAKIVSTETLKDFAIQLAGVHAPLRFDWHAKFGLSKQVAALPKLETKAEQPTNQASQQKPLNEVDSEAQKKSKLECVSCGAIAPYNVARFCWLNKNKFGGNVYCMDCQKSVQTD